jgi:dynein heavy chain 1, cytosolic
MQGDDPSVLNTAARILKKVIVIKILRPDRLLATINQLLAASLGDDITQISQVDLTEFSGAKIRPKNPIMLVSAPGYDASLKVEMLAKQVNKKYTAVAMGSPEAFAQVDQAIRNAGKSGSWVLLKNVHLVPNWLGELEKKIYNMTLDS